MTPENKDECLALFDQWREGKSLEGAGLDEEREAVCELLNNWDVLDITGGCLRVDGKMVAFSLGEALLGDTMVIHLEHADTSYEGSFAMMNREFLLNEWSGYKYVNREEDLGIEGLRKAKLSYQPAILLEKITAKRI